MNIEYEATFVDIDKKEVRNRLRKAGAELIRPEFLQKRVVFHLPKGHEIKGGWLRVRDEGKRITMSLKVVDGNKIENQKEMLLEVNDFMKAEQFLIAIGCQKKAFQESKREIWRLGGVEITIDEWPFLEPFVEIEGKTEKLVKSASGKLGFDYAKALFCSIDTLYANRYGFSPKVINNQTPRICFDMKNPFLSKGGKFSNKL